MELVTKLKTCDTSLTVDTLPVHIQKDIEAWAQNHAQELFMADDEKRDIETEVKRTVIADVIRYMEDE